MRHTILVLAGLAIAATSISRSTAATRIAGDRGGLLTGYVEWFEAARDTGERIIIDGPCFSASTLAIALMRRGQVCVTPKAVLGFHAAWRPTANGGRRTSEAATEAMYEVYPSNVRRWGSIATVACRSGSSFSKAANSPKWCPSVVPGRPL
jgi:hypothetical protein